MANFIYTEAKRALAEGEIDFASDDIRVVLCMTNTTCDTEEDVTLMNGFSGDGLDEYDGSNYGRAALANEAVASDEANDRAEFDATDYEFTALGVGTRQCQGAVLYQHVTNDTDSIPIAWIDAGGFPFDGNGGNVTIQWNAQGIIQIT